MMAVPIEMEGEFKAGTSRLLFEGSYTYGFLDYSFNYDVAPDGRHFVMVKEGETAAELHVVTNWFDELKRLVPTN